MNGDIYHDIRKLCNDVFCRKETVPMRFSLVSMPRPLPSSPNSTWNCGQGCPNTNIYECMGTWLLTIFLDSFSALFDRSRSESSCGRQISGQFSIESSHIISWRFYLFFAQYNLKSWMGKNLSSNTLSTQLSTVLSNFICSFFNSGNSLQNFSTVQNQSHRSGNTGKSGGAVCWPVQITHLLNFSTVIVLLNTDMVLQLLSIVVNNSKNWHCLQSGKMKAEFFIYLFIYLAFSLSGEGHCYRFPQLQQAL